MGRADAGGEGRASVIASVIHCAIRRTGDRDWPDTDTADLDEGRCREKAEWPPANVPWARANPVVRFGRFREIR
jgi:hypothetical protein